jgi:ABC-type arginine/histidine transport system permease subunit
MSPLFIKEIICSKKLACFVFTVCWCMYVSMCRSLTFLCTQIYPSPLYCFLNNICHFFPFFFLGGTRIWTQSFICKAGTPPLEPYLQSTLLWLFWRSGVMNYLLRLALNLISSSQVARITGVSHCAWYMYGFLSTYYTPGNVPEVSCLFSI